MMIIQKQKWSGHSRILFVDKHSSVMLELFDKPQFGDLNIIAFIFNLWVEPEYRRQGFAKKMLQIAEQTAFEYGHQEVFLDWNEKDAPREIRDWYIRNGYVEVGFNKDGTFSRLKKKISNTNQHTK